MGRSSCHRCAGGVSAACSWSSRTRTAVSRLGVQRCLQGSGRQRCRVHFIGNLLAVIPNRPSADGRGDVCERSSPRPSAQAASEAWDEVRDRLSGSFSKTGPLMDDTEDEVLAFAGFPKAHWQKIWLCQPAERLNKEIKRRSRVVGIFPNPAAALRLVGAVLADTHDEWQANPRRYLLRRIHTTNSTRWTPHSPQPSSLPADNPATRPRTHTAGHPVSEDAPPAVEATEPSNSPAGLQSTPPGSSPAGCREIALGCTPAARQATRRLDRRYFSEEFMSQLNAQDVTLTTVEFTLRHITPRLDPKPPHSTGRDAPPGPARADHLHR